MKKVFLIGITKTGEAELINSKEYGDSAKIRNVVNEFKTKGSSKYESVLMYVDPFDKIRLGKPEKISEQKKGK